MPPAPRGSYPFAAICSAICSSRRRFLLPLFAAAPGAAGGANLSPPKPNVPSGRITISTWLIGSTVGLFGSHCSSSGLSGFALGRFANSDSIASISARGSCFSFICRSCASRSHRIFSAFFSSRFSWSSTMAYAISIPRRISRSLSKLTASFSRLRRVCGRFVFSRCRNTLNGFASLGAGGGCRRRRQGFPVRLRLSHQYSYTASKIAGRPERSCRSSTAFSFGRASVPAIIAHFSWYEMTKPFSVAFAAWIAMRSSFASPHTVSSFQIITSSFSAGKRFCPSLYFSSQSSSSLSRSYSTTSPAGAPNVRERKYVRLR